MRHNLAFVTAACLIALSAVAWTDAQQAQPVSAESMDEVLRAVRADLQNSRSDIIAKNVSLTTTQAAQFWPLFEAYQKEQNVIMERRVAA